MDVDHNLVRARQLARWALSVAGAPVAEPLGDLRKPMENRTPHPLLGPCRPGQASGKAGFEYFDEAA